MDAAEVDHPAASFAGPNAGPIVVRLADEGLPVLAIARAMRRPSLEIYEVLRAAIAEGIIVEMPRDDWPPGNSRSQRFIVPGTLLDNEDLLRRACARFFKATPLEAAILATLLTRSQASKEQLHHVVEATRRGELNKRTTDPKMVDVMICKLRKKITPYNILIETMWGVGYLIQPAVRDTAVRLLTAGAPE